MFLYTSARLSDTSLSRSNSDAFLSKTIKRELITVVKSRSVLKDTTSSKLSIKGSKQADAAHKVEIGILRKQINTFDVNLREEARTSYLLQQNIRKKDLQDFQCSMLCKIESLLRKNIIETGMNYRKYKLGGHEHGAYELFFRVEPARYMTKAQLVTALRRSFGNQLIAFESSIGKLFDSFDFYRTDELDWRALLYLLTILMQPYLPCQELIRWGYSLYSSVGSLDLECSEKLSLGMLKDMLCVPVLLSKRNELKFLVDKSWEQLTKLDLNVLEYAAMWMQQEQKRQIKRHSKGSIDPDSLKITFSMLEKILSLDTELAKLMQIGLPYGSKDKRIWTTVFEEEFYHTVVLEKLKKRRREERNEIEADEFIAKAFLRKKYYSMLLWKDFVVRRKLLRKVFIGCELRVQIILMGYFFDHWKKISIEEICCCLIQRCARGYIAKCRCRFLKKLYKKVVKVQSNSRKLLKKIKYNQKRWKLYWAAVSIQRVVRGNFARIRVATLVQERFDQGLRELRREKAEWQLSRENKAATAIQEKLRKFVKIRKRIKKMVLEQKIDKVEREMEKRLERIRIQENVFKQELSAWYKKRREDFEETIFNENQTVEQKKKIRERRYKKFQEEKIKYEAEREAQLQRIQDEEVEIWLAQWEEKIAERGKLRRKQCENCLLLPETPEDVKLKKNLQLRIKTHIKEVLERADKQKIPMEVPEAKEISTREIIDEEVNNELDRARAEMREQAAKKQNEEKEKNKRLRKKEKKGKKKKRMFAILIIQSYVRQYMARKKMRQRAYRRYKRHFDVENHEYYYEDKKTGKTFWEKPKVLGSYEIPMDDQQWITMLAYPPQGTTQESAPLVYFYNPSTWDQSWVQPEGTILCEFCSQNFVVAFLHFDQNKYCETCFNAKVEEIIQETEIPTRELFFQPINGGRTDAELADFLYVDVQNVYDFTLELKMKANRNLKKKSEEEVEEEELELRILELQELKNQASFHTSLTESGKKNSLSRRSTSFKTESGFLPDIHEKSNRSRRRQLEKIRMVGKASEVLKAFEEGEMKLIEKMNSDDNF